VSTRPKTLGELSASGCRPRSVKREIRESLMRILRNGGELFAGIIGYERTVIPAIVNAVLAKELSEDGTAFAYRVSRLFEDGPRSRRG
jgi:magnesium chelatase subunit I